MRWLTMACAGVLAAVLAACSYAAEAPPSLPAKWDMTALSQAPKITPLAETKEPGVEGLFYDALPWKGKPTRVFAWRGLPAAVKTGKAPGMVLVHGGGGTAHARWVRLWNQRGYAAIVMDLCGKAHGPTEGKPAPHAMSGPSGWDDSFEQTDWPVEDQWQYHAVADIVLANSLLRSMPEVDAGRIGLTGISWGGYLVCIAAGVDDRFRFVAPVYGCGFIGEDSVWVPKLEKMGKEKAGRWLAHWDPSHYLPRAKMPMLWVTGDRDFAYPLDSLQKSYRLPPGERYLAIRPAMPHGHEQGETPAEIHAFAEQVMGAGVPLARCTGQGVDGRKAWATFAFKSALAKAQCVYTKDTGPWQNRKWDVADAALDAAGKATFDLPDGVTVFYFMVTDQRNLVASSEHVTLSQAHLHLAEERVEGSLSQGFHARNAVGLGVGQEGPPARQVGFDCLRRHAAATPGDALGRPRGNHRLERVFDRSPSPRHGMARLAVGVPEGADAALAAAGGHERQEVNPPQGLVRHAQRLVGELGDRLLVGLGVQVRGEAAAGCHRHLEVPRHRGSPQVPVVRARPDLVRDEALKVVGRRAEVFKRAAALDGDDLGARREEPEGRAHECGLSDASWPGCREETASARRHVCHLGGHVEIQRARRQQVDEAEHPPAALVQRINGASVVLFEIRHGECAKFQVSGFKLPATAGARLSLFHVKPET